MGRSCTEEVDAILQIVMKRTYPDQQKEAAKETIREFEDQFDYDCAYELAESSHPAIRRAAEEINAEDDETMAASHKSL